MQWFLHKLVNNRARNSSKRPAKSKQRFQMTTVQWPQKTTEAYLVLARFPSDTYAYPDRCFVATAVPLLLCLRTWILRQAFQQLPHACKCCSLSMQNHSDAMIKLIELLGVLFGEHLYSFVEPLELFWWASILTIKCQVVISMISINLIDV